MAIKLGTHSHQQQVPGNNPPWQTPGGVDSESKSLRGNAMAADWRDATIAACSGQ